MVDIGMQKNQKKKNRLYLIKITTHCFHLLTFNLEIASFISSQSSFIHFVYDSGYFLTILNKIIENTQTWLFNSTVNNIMNICSLSAKARI